MSDDRYADLETLDLEYPVWDRCFTVAPLVLVGTISLTRSRPVTAAPIG